MCSPEVTVDPKPNELPMIGFWESMTTVSSWEQSTVPKVYCGAAEAIWLKAASPASAKLLDSIVMLVSVLGSVLVLRCGIENEDRGGGGVEVLLSAEIGTEL